MTGAELTEKFFEEIKKWEWQSPSTMEAGCSTFGHWLSLDGTKCEELPELDTSLDLQEEWVCTELRKRKIDLVVTSYSDGSGKVEPFDRTSKFTDPMIIIRWGIKGGLKTKAEAQLKAILQALGKL